MKTSLRDKPTWLHDLMHDNMSPDEIVKGFVKFYALQGLTVNHVQDDIHFRMLSGDTYASDAMIRLLQVLEDFARTADCPGVTNLDKERSCI